MMNVIFSMLSQELIGLLLSMNILGLVGVFIALQKKELAGDVIAHATLLGIALSAIIKNVFGDCILSNRWVGAFVSAMLALLLVDFFHRRNPKITEDTSLALVLSMFVGWGFMLLTYIQMNDYEDQANLKEVFFGSVAVLEREDVKQLALIMVLVVLAILIFFKEWRLLCFDRAFALSIGLPVAYLDALLRFITVLAIVGGVHTVGPILATPMLIVPAVAAGFWTQKLGRLLVFTCFFTCLSSVISHYVASRVEDVPTEGLVVLVAITLLLVAGFVAPGGFFYQKWKAYQYDRRIVRENLLKAFYELGKRDDLYYAPRDLTTLVEQKRMGVRKLRGGMARLCGKGLARRVKNDVWALTSLGFTYGKHMLNRHLLWETYLKAFVKIKDNHVHDDAEAIEHLITPRIEAMLREALAKRGISIDGDA